MSRSTGQATAIPAAAGSAEALTASRTGRHGRIHYFPGLLIPMYGPTGAAGQLPVEAAHRSAEPRRQGDEVRVPERPDSAGSTCIHATVTKIADPTR